MNMANPDEDEEISDDESSSDESDTGDQPTPPGSARIAPRSGSNENIVNK